MFEFPIVMNAVQSGNVAESGYSPAQQVMEVKFKNGGRYRYKGVPQAIYDAYLVAPSKGSFVSSHLRGKFECVKYEEKSENIDENKS